MSVDSEGCSRSGMDVDDNVGFSIVVVGETGNGKSQFCEAMATMAGIKSNFQPGRGRDAQTTAVVSSAMSLCRFKFHLYDTPGLNDIGDRDSEHISVMVKELRKLSNVGLIILVLNAMQPRLTKGMVETVRHFFDIFGCHMISNLAFLWTHCPKVLASKMRNSPDTVGIINDLLKEAGVTSHAGHIPCFFVNSVNDEMMVFSVDALRNEISSILNAANANELFDMRQAIAEEENEKAKAKEREQELDRERAGRLEAERRQTELLETMKKAEEEHKEKERLMQEDKEYMMKKEKEREIEYELTLKNALDRKGKETEAEFARREAENLKALRLEAEKREEAIKAEFEERQTRNNEERDARMRVLETQFKELNVRQEAAANMNVPTHQHQQNSRQARARARDSGQVYYRTPKGSKVHLQHNHFGAKIKLSEKEIRDGDLKFCEICAAHLN